MRLSLLLKTKQDVRSIIVYIARELCAPQAALSLNDAIEKHINALSEMPSRVKIFAKEPWKKAGVRRSRVKNFYVYFVIDEGENCVNILAVIYIGRDQEKQLEDKGIS